MSKLFIQNSIEIQADAATVWNVLTSAKHTPKYMFGCQAVTDWKVGSQLLWQANYEGKDMVFVKGVIKEYFPEKQLVYSTIDPNNPSIDDIPENYLDVYYIIEKTNKGVVLTVKQGNYKTVAQGEQRYNESIAGGGWQSIIEQIKIIAEELQS